MSKYEKFSRDELLALVQKQDGELASKKYGLVWDAEREPEQVVLDCAENLPVLRRVKGKEIRTDEGEDNILIEGDNYHALTVLNYTHKEKIDVIYIDPPYNTGNKDFKYNDRFVDKEDGFRHSKWLNFMEKRLNLAKDLLKQTGVIFISIDDNEQAQLKMLCDKIFGQDNFIAQIIWQKKYTQSNDAKYFSSTHDFILCYAKNTNDNGFKISLLLRTDEQTARYSNPDNDPRGPWASQPIQAKTPSNAGMYEIITPRGRKISPPNGRSWQFSMLRYEELVKDNRIWFGEDGKNVPRIKKFLSEVKEGVIPKTIWLYDEVGSNDDGKRLLKEILPEQSFDSPKPRSLVEYIIKLSSGKNAMVLDFMAGSGTTGHAVLELNKEDGGNRKFILCTNNEVNGLEKELREKGLSEKEIQEYGICRRITYPRIQKVIKGYKKNGDGKKVEGLGGNLQYFTTALVADTKNKKQTKMSLRGQCTDMLCVRENMFRLDTEADDYKIFSSNTGNSFLCVYYNLKKNSFKDFLKIVKKLKGKKKIYVFSLSGKIDTEIFDGIDDCEIEEIPEQIMKRYEELVRMNISVKPETIFLEVDKAQKKIFEDKEKDEGARILRIALEKTIKKIAQKNHVNVLKGGGKGEKTALLNDRLHDQKIFNKIQWEENKTSLAIGNNASHGEYEDYDMEQVENFYRHVQSLLHDFGI